MQTLQQYKQKGRALRRHLAATLGTEVSLSQAYEALAAMEGASSWNVLSARLAASGASAMPAAPEVLQGATLTRLPPVRALLHTLDGKARAEFDASAWFAQASERDICALLEETPRMTPTCFVRAYGGESGLSDEVAAFVAPTDSEVGQVYAYIAAMAAVGQDCGGSDCYVDADSLRDWLEARAALELVQALPGSAPADMQGVLDVMMQDVVGDYEVPDTVPEWQWVQRNASFTHRDNGKDGVWDFMVNVACAGDAADMPALLQPLFAQARRQQAGWVLFHQGT